MFDVIKTAYALKNGVNVGSVYNWRAPVFLFTNENIAGYLRQMRDLRGARVLTVAASGDHAFECLLRGAKSVDTFDVNYLQKHVVELKSKMIKHLSYWDFNSFFFDKTKFFNRDILKPIWHRFSPALRIFLNQYYHTKNDNLFRYRGAQSPFYSTDKITYINDISAYNELARIMPNEISFTQTDLLNIPFHFDTVYDTILLSNISEYMFDEVPDSVNKIQMFYDKVLCPIADKNLNENHGQIGFSYAWCANRAEYRKMIDYIQRSMKYSVNSFDFTNRKIDMAAVPSVSLDELLLMNPRPDVMLYMTQNQKLR